MSEYREYLTPESGTVGKDGRIYRAYLTPDDDPQPLDDEFVSMVTYRDDSRYASESGPLAEDYAATIREAISRFRYAAGYRYNGLSYAMIERADAMLVRYLRIFHDLLAHPVSMGSNRDFAVAFMPRTEFEEAGFAVPFAQVATSNAEYYNMWADGDVWGYVIEVADAPPAPLFGEPDDVDESDWEVEDCLWGFYGTADATSEANETLASFGVKIGAGV